MDYLSRRAAKLQVARMRLESIYRCPSIQPAKNVSYRSKRQCSQDYLDNYGLEESEEICSWQDCCITIFLFFMLLSSSAMLSLSVDSIFQSAVVVQQKIFSELY